MPKNPEVLAALSTLTKALEAEPMPADVAMARLLEACARVEAKLDQLLARPAAPVVTIAPVGEPTPTAAPTPPPAEPKRGRKVKAEERPAPATPAPAPETPPPAPEAPPACAACSATLTPENSSKRHSDGALVHVGCPKAEPAPGDVEVLNVRQLKAAPAAAPAPEAPKAEQKPVEPPPAPAPAAEASGLPSFEVLRQAALAHIQRHGKPSLLAALSTYGAQKISDLQDANKAAALEKLNGPACVDGAPLA